MPKSIHKKNEIIKSEGVYYKCICTDSEYAIFVKSNKSGTRTKFKNMFVVSNVIDDFEYELIHQG